ncbi:MAG: hypothetical protein J4F48_14885, partial [Nitrospinae bacterium]|nr:hypothetical protein [Nitrospinota bacterium]
IGYEIQVGGYAVHELQALMGAREAVELHTHHYLEGNVATGQLLPRLVGFLSAEERAFFLSFIKVPGISPKSGVRAMSLPPLQIAEAIATANTIMLTKLPGIGRKKAEQVISTLREEIADRGSIGRTTRRHAPARRRHGRAGGAVGLPNARGGEPRGTRRRHAGSGRRGRSHPTGSLPAEPIGRKHGHRAARERKGGEPGGRTNIHLAEAHAA